MIEYLIFHKAELSEAPYNDPAGIAQLIKKSIGSGNYVFDQDKIVSSLRSLLLKYMPNQCYLCLKKINPDENAILLVLSEKRAGIEIVSKYAIHSYHFFV